MKNDKIIEEFSFKKEEQETVAIYDYQLNSWTITSNVQKHISKILKLYPEHTTIKTVNKNGTPTSVIARGLPEIVTFRSLKE